MKPTRRALVVGAAGAAAATGFGLAAWPSPPSRPPHGVPQVPAGGVVSGSFRSAARGGRRSGWSIAYPPGSRTDAALPVALVLHGRGNNHATVFGSHALQFFLAAVVGAGVRPFALAAVDGGDHSYWHRRADGSDAQRMILDEFLPLLTARGLRTTRVALSGWSMGGYGALLLAEHLGAGRCAAVAVDSPALWLSPGDSAPGAFDDREDFLRNDVFAQRARLAGVPVRVAIGTSDPFYVATRRFVAELSPRPQTDFSRGGHDVTFWRHSAPAQLHFLGAALAGT
jgi:enterochelin esterase-like enzyme